MSSLRVRTPRRRNIPSSRPIGRRRAILPRVHGQTAWNRQPAPDFSQSKHHQRTPAARHWAGDSAGRAMRRETFARLDTRKARRRASIPAGIEGQNPAIERIHCLPLTA